MWTRQIQFEVQELLGEGSQGRVYKALRRDAHSGLTQTVALKVLHSENAVELWKREFESLSRVRSPYCVQVFAFERINGCPALVLEYIEGLPLSRLNHCLWLDSDEVEEIISQIEAGLRDLQEQGVFHGDLSPQNVIVDRNGRVRLLDFGLANCSARHARLTPEFSAPERLAGEPAGWNSDLFSLGRIEQFLKGEDLSGLSPSPLLRLSPAERHGYGRTPRRKPQGGLAQKISTLLERERLARGLHTRRQEPGPSAVRTGIVFSRLFASFTIASLLFVCSADTAHFHLPQPLATLLIRTQFWHRIRVNGTPLGYAPVSVFLRAGVKHKLEWTSALAKGQRTLTLAPGEQLHLRDRDFSH
ncbi:MAG: serine/threonine-protein kinase [Bdellovibrionales bacterium]